MNILLEFRRLFFYVIGYYEYHAGLVQMKSMVPKILICAFLLLAAQRAGFAENHNHDHLLRFGYMQGSGGSVGALGSVDISFEHEFWRIDRSNLAVSISGDFLMDRSADGLSRAVYPVLLNVRRYAGADFTGFYFSGGLGMAIAAGPFHGGSDLSWQGSFGYLMPSHFFIEGRYIGRNGENVIYSGATFKTNTQFLGGVLGYSF